ncbi:hypothetical protein [Okeania sp. SIO2B3]|nr:hypothetical protein [Okeania sp. SIO2B3]
MKKLLVLVKNELYQLKKKKVDRDTEKLSLRVYKLQAIIDTEGEV